MWFDACIFDLDGVIVDTAKYHYLSWKRVAETLGIPFTEKENERLKGVSRIASLEIILERGNKQYPESRKEELAEIKNRWYVEYISKMTADEILPGAVDLLKELRGSGIKTAIASASKNTPLILERVAIRHLFDAVADGNIVTKAKPDPEVFLAAASMLGSAPSKCIVFEDAAAGIRAAHNAGICCIGTGDPQILSEADLVVSGLYEINLKKLIELK